MTLQRRIALLSCDHDLSVRFEQHCAGKGFQTVSLSDPSQVLGFVYADPPDVIVIDLPDRDTAFHRVLTELKQDSYFSVIPVLGLVGEELAADAPWDRYPLDDFVSRPVGFPELLSRILLSLQRMRRVFDNNPLSKLPGNTSIQNAIEQSLGKSMAVCYIDINNFKPYNDTYGFSRGDEVIRMVARIMSNSVRESRDGGFAGHVGGDDFVFIVPLEHAEAVCKRIIANFSIIVSDLFGEEDKARGYYMAKDRRGVEQRFPLLGISIAVVPTSNIRHAGKVAEIAAELKKLAKKSPESCYVVDRRKN
jgi:GGDEF domain-containing protein